MAKWLCRNAENDKTYRQHCGQYFQIVSNYYEKFFPFYISKDLSKIENAENDKTYRHGEAALRT